MSRPIYISPRELSAKFDRIWPVSPVSEAVQYLRMDNFPECANIYAGVLSLNPKSACTLTKINLGYIRDLVSSGVLSLIGDSANLAASGA